MAVKVEIPQPLREYTDGLVEIEVTGTTVRDALQQVVQQYPNIESRLFDNGALRPYINVVVNDEDIRYLDDLDTAVENGHVIALIPAVAGG
ncbi:MAG: ubiquitin-like small modifier protein 1 [Zavarzinella sp.]